jgi:hypothetical protein
MCRDAARRLEKLGVLAAEGIREKILSAPDIRETPRETWGSRGIAVPRGENPIVNYVFPSLAHRLVVACRAMREWAICPTCDTDSNAVATLPAVLALPFHGRGHQEERATPYMRAAGPWSHEMHPGRNSPSLTHRGLYTHDLRRLLRPSGQDMGGLPCLPFGGSHPCLARRPSPVPYTSAAPPLAAG